MRRERGLVINPHKRLLVPIDCSLVWTSRPDEWREAFTLRRLEYLRSDDEAFSLADFGPPLGRRFRSLKLWATLRVYGAEGLRAILREHIRLAGLFAGVGGGERRLGARRPAALLPRRLPLERHRRGERADPARVNASGEIFITHTKLDGRYVLRLAIGNARTKEEHVRQAWDVLNREAKR